MTDEVIVLSDDDVLIDDKIDDNLKKSVTPTPPPTNKRSFRCLNSDCRSEEKLIKAEEYVRRYFGVLPYPKKKRVCETCHAEAEDQQESLVNCITSGRLLLAERIPPPKTTVVLTDSDSDPSDDSASDAESEYVFEEEGGHTLEKEILALTKELGLDRQISEGVKHLEDMLLKIQGSFNELEADYSKTETSLDNVRKNFYNTFRLDIMWQPPLDIGPSSVPLPPDGGGEVIAEPSVVVPNENLPPVGPLQRWELAPNEMVYSMKYSLFARWVQAQVIEVDHREPKNTFYRIRYNRNTKGNGMPRVMEGRQLAYYEPCATRIPVGTRIIAKYKDDDPKNTTISGSFYVGIVAEIPTAANKYRYLIFFDDGYAQYVNHPDIRVVTEASACSWEDVSSDSREFIKEYLQMYPERPMVRLQKWNYVKTEWNGRWWRAQVKEVDGSLVKMFFPPLEGRCEWIYRGSTRLSPLFHKKMNIAAQAEQPLRTIRRRTAALPSRAVVEYGTFGQGQDMDSVSGPTAEVSGQPRSVARKSTSRPSRPGTPPKEILLKVEQESKGFTNQHSFPEKAVRFNNHLCTSQCLGAGDSMKKYKGLSPLLQPLLFGWRRQFVKICRKTVNRYEIYYTAPCGRRLGTIEDVFKYLLITESNLEIDCFSFELSVMVTHEWEPFKKIVDIDDFSKGEENVPISCVNSLEEILPQELNYCNVRLPGEHVPLNLDPDFLVCCDCTDDCKDKSKCACWQQTISNTRILERQENQSAGYTYRRLFEQVQTGIYECNTKCKCSNHCLNKVVQHPLRLKLQLFKTARRGWGVRTLHDVPRGGFICVYVGRMLNEAIANEEGKILGGDDYYAELDYIEVMERAKEGYEEEAMNIEEDATYQPDTRDHGEALRNIRASDSNDSESFYSDNETDNTKEDTDFSLSYMKKGGLGKREKSARLQERAARRSRSNSQQNVTKEESSRSNSDDDQSKAKSKNKKKKEGGDEESKEKNSNGEEEKKDNADEDEGEEEDDEDDVKQRQPQPFVPRQLMEANMAPPKMHKSIRDCFGKDEAVYIMDAKHTGNIGRFLNHSCEPNVFVQNVFVDTHDLRFPWIAFFAINNIKAGTELTWDYSYDVGSVAGKIKYCYCGARKCRGRLL